MTKLFTAKECLRFYGKMEIEGRVLVVKQKALPAGDKNPLHQLCYCPEPANRKSIAANRPILTHCLSDGSAIGWRRDEILGVLRPALLPEAAKLCLARMGPECLPEEKNAPHIYTGRCFLPGGEMSGGVKLCSKRQAIAYVDMQTPYQYGVQILDRCERTVLELTGGKPRLPAGRIQAVFQETVAVEQMELWR